MEPYSKLYDTLDNFSDSLESYGSSKNREGEEMGTLNFKIRKDSIYNNYVPDYFYGGFDEIQNFNQKQNRNFDAYYL